MTSTEVAPLPWCHVDSRWSVRQTLAPHRAGRRDPTTRLGERSLLRASRTPDGPGTLRLTWSDDPADAAQIRVDADAWGPGSDWLLGRVDALIGRHDRAVRFPDADPAVERALATHRTTRLSASGDAYHLLLPTVIGQRITGREAAQQWERLARALGQPAPGPVDIVGGLVVPPDPAELCRCPLWWFHPIGIEASRARALVEVARHVDKFWAWAESGAAVLTHRLQLLRGVGPWTAAEVAGPVCGDGDAVPVGDYHYPNIVAWALAGEARADDARMLDLLAPYAPHRGRVLRALVATIAPPKFGPRRRILPMHRW